MVLVIDYYEGKRYVQDTKIRRRQRVWERGGKEKQRKDRGEEKHEMKQGDKKQSRLPTQKKRRYRPGTVTLCKIQKFQKSKVFFIHKFQFTSWVRKIVQQQKGDLHFQATALLTWKEVVKAFAVNLFEDANFAIHTKHITVMPKDIQLACRTQEDMVKYLPM